MTDTVTKSQIFDLFYSKQDVVRSGGGKLKTKMSRNKPPLQKVEELEKKIKENKKLYDYFLKLRTRKPDIAPPPRPSD